MSNEIASRRVTQAAFDRLEAASKRKPRIALMGEFSAGKSTLMNLLMGAETLPTQVTATQLPPVWFKFGSGEPFRLDVDGNYHEIDLTNMTGTPVTETRYIQVFLESDILEICDLIDTPGISDPNIPAEVWERAVHHADGVIWCTHATQAWRQSENAVWGAMPKRLRENSLLLLTRADKLIRESDKERLLKRIDREAGEYFLDRYPVALLDAIAAGDDYDKWVASGADAFVTRLIDVIETKRAKRASLLERYSAIREVDISRPSQLRQASEPSPFRVNSSRDLDRIPVVEETETPNAFVQSEPEPVQPLQLSNDAPEPGQAAMAPEPEVAPAPEQAVSQPQTAETPVIAEQHAVPPAADAPVQSDPAGSHLTEVPQAPAEQPAQKSIMPRRVAVKPSSRARRPG